MIFLCYVCKYLVIYFLFFFIIEQLEDDEPKFLETPHNTKENIITNKNIITSKFKYRKVNNYKNVNKFLSTKIDNRNCTKIQNKIKQNLITATNNSSKVHVKTNSVNLTSVINKTDILKKNLELVNNIEKTEKYNLEINEIVKNSHVKNCKELLNETFYKTSDVSQALLNIDKYMINVQDYLTSSKYVVNKEDISTLPNNPTNNHAKNVYVNRNFQTQLMSKNLLNSNLKNPSDSLLSIKKTASTNKKKRLSEMFIQSPNLIKIGNTKLIRQSLFRNKWKINNKLSGTENNVIERKPLSALQCPTTNTLITPYNKTKWTKVIDPTPALAALKPKSSNSSSTNKLKWTRPNILLVNNVHNNSCSVVPRSDKLILFGKNKIIRQSLISSTQSKNKNYLLKHLSHRLALMRKLQQKNSIHKLKNMTTNNEYVKSSLLLKRTVTKPVEIKRNGKKLYSYVNPILRFVCLFFQHKIRFDYYLFLGQRLIIILKWNPQILFHV